MDVDLAVRSHAVSLAAEAALRPLNIYYRQNCAKLRDIFYDVLLYVPEICNTDEYYRLIMLVPMDTDDEIEIDEVTISTSTDNFNRVHKFALTEELTLRTLSLEQFLDQRVRCIDEKTGLVQEEFRLLKAFPDILRSWRLGIIRPLSILHRCGLFRSIAFMEELDVLHAIAICVGGTNDEDLEQILEDVLIPWAQYRNVVDELCKELMVRLGSSAGVDLRKVLRILSTSMQSGLSQSNKSIIASGAMIACYKKPLYADGRDHTGERQTIVAILQNTFNVAVYPEIELHEPPIRSLVEFSEALTDPGNQLHNLVVPSPSSIAILQEFIDGSELFDTVYDAVLLKFSAEEVQMRRLRAKLLERPILENIRTARLQLLRQKVLNKIPVETIEYLVLKTVLLNHKNDLARQIYIAASPRPLPSRIVEEAMLESFDELFDNATSINRRALNPASQVLSIIHPKHTNQEIRTRQLMVDTLIELSAYQGSQMTQPVLIKKFDSKAVLQMFSRVLEEPGNHKKHFRLLGLYQNLCLALAVSPDVGEFYALCANAALSSDDLNGALAIVDESETTFDEQQGEEQQSSRWRLLYQVCRYPSDSKAVIEKQLELLSVAIEICPAADLHQHIVLYRRLEKALEQCLHDSTEDRESDTQTHNIQEAASGDRRPGPPSFQRQMSARGPSTTKIEMPQWRLFEAAQAATQTAREFLPRSTADGRTQEGRVRKRDQIAGLVGSGVGVVESGFTSGLGWIRKCTNV